MAPDPRRKKKGRARRYVSPKRVYRRARGGLGRIGGRGMLSWALGSAGLVVTQRYQPFGGAYKPAIDKVATGAVLYVCGIDNKDLITAGIKEGIATAVNQYLLGGAAAGGAGVGEVLG